MERLHRNTLSYWLFLVGAAGFSMFAAAIAAFGLSMSLVGRFDGGVSANAIVTVLLLLWVAMVGALDVALWRTSRLPAGVQPMLLAFSRQPTERAEAAVWWWLRAFLCASVLFMAMLLLTAAIAWLFDPWRNPVNSRCSPPSGLLARRSRSSAPDADPES